MNRRSFLGFLAAAPVAAPLAAQAAFAAPKRFGTGGVLGRAGFVPMGGEHGPEIIMPFRRGTDGRLGVHRVAKIGIEIDTSALARARAQLDEFAAAASRIREHPAFIEQVVDPIGVPSAAAVAPVSEHRPHAAQVALADRAAPEQHAKGDVQEVLGFPQPPFERSEFAARHIEHQEV